MRSLNGQKIAVAGARKFPEIAAMIEKLGGIPLSRPMQGTVYLDDTHMRNEVMRVVEEDLDWLILTTGIGTEALIQAAEGLGVKTALLEKLKRIRIAARGYKTVNVLREYGIVPAVRDDDGTTAGLIRALEDKEWIGRKVVLQLYGDPAPRFQHWLQERGAILEEVLPYRHVPPEADVLERMLEEVIHGEVDAVVFTSAPQIRFLAAGADAKGRLDLLLRSFEQRVTAAAVGKVTAEALAEEGIKRMVVPKVERIGSMIVALADDLGARET